MTIETIPFDYKGNMMDYPGTRWVHNPEHPNADARGYIHMDPEWRDNKPFHLPVLHLDTYGRGRSSVRFMWIDGDGHTYPMFVSDMVEVVKMRRIEDGAVRDSQWIGKKKGANYGIGLAL